MKTDKKLCKSFTQKTQGQTQRQSALAPPQSLLLDPDGSPPKTRARHGPSHFRKFWIGPCIRFVNLFISVDTHRKER